MPPPESARQLTDEDKETLARWISEGAEYQPHWSFVPLPATVPVPEVQQKEWPRNEIDHFIQARLEKMALKPAQAAEPERWLRRVAFDLTGLSPSQAELDLFLADKSPEAREKAVDRLLASPRYGEKMSVAWLDVARYADSYGYQSDIDTHAWPYRDWVIQAHNQNLPWDQFITWQVAGDLLPDPTREQLTATAFNRIHRKTNEGGSVEEEFRQDGIADRVHTFGFAFLGLTFECTRCHDHKYDPLSQKDYFSMAAFFNSIDEWGLLHGDAKIPPNPTLLLTTSQQEKDLADQKAAVAKAEAALLDIAKSREAAFQTWLAKPEAKWVDMSGSYTLDSVEKKKFPNPKDPKKNGPEEQVFVNSNSADLPARSNFKNTPVPGKLGQAISFSGDDPLSLGKHAINHREDAMSMFFWLKPNERNKRTIIFHDSGGMDPGYNGFELLLENGTLRWMVAREWPANCIAIRSKDIIREKEWVHITTTYDGSAKAAGLKIFVNGVETPVEMVRDHLVKDSISGKGFDFGERVRDVGLRGGAVDEIRLFTRAVSALEARTLFENKDIAETVKAASRDEAGMAQLREFYLTGIDPEYRKALADLKELRKKLRMTLDEVKELPIMKETEAPRAAYVLARGDYTSPEGDPLPRLTPAALPPMDAALPKNRLGLAKWLIEPSHPLTARVHVNRVWQHFFGRGLVSTSENFGTQGEAPSHQELLDWLARDFISNSWNMKQLCKQIVLSATYSQDSKASSELREKDSANIWLARGPAKRLSGEDLRDQALALSGLLAPEIGGPPTKPYLPDAATWKVLNNFLPEYQRDAAPQIYRRSLYSFWRRTAPPPGMLAFDVPGRDVCSVRRQQTNTPLQPLVTLNDPQFVEASRGLAMRMMKEGGSDMTAQARWVFREAIGREAREEEVKLLTEMHAEQLEIFRQDPKKADDYLKVGELKAPADIPAPDLAAATVLTNAIMNLDESITLR